jgi:hypothetical protein
VESSASRASCSGAFFGVNSCRSNSRGPFSTPTGGTGASARPRGPHPLAQARVIEGQLTVNVWTSSVGAHGVSGAVGAVPPVPRLQPPLLLQLDPIKGLSNLFPSPNLQLIVLSLPS